MNKLENILVASGLILGITSANAAVVDFDDYVDGTPITNQYQSLGVLFSSNGGVPSRILLDSFEATTPPNILTGANVFSNIFVSFVDPASGELATVKNVAVDVISVGHSQWTVTSKDLQGNTIQNFVLQNLSGPVNGIFNVDHLSFSGSNIAAIDFVLTEFNPGDGVGIDTLSFSPVPVPPVAWVFAAAVGGLARARRRTC